MEIEIKLPWPDWQVTKLLGSGGYGRVYEIHRDRYGISEVAAVKVLSFPKDEDEISEGLRSGYVEETLAAEYRQQVESVLKEYRLLKELGDDPHIVRCDDYAAVPHSNGIGWNVYLKMELLTPLKQYLGKNAIPPEQTVQLGSDICQALAACWAKRILHRDIKPDNILVSGKGVFKLSDFGEAKLVEKTMASGVAGTWSFVAPEVGNHSRYGEPADIYSLGMVLYWMLNRCMLPFLPRPWGLCSTAEQDQARHRRLSGEPLPPPADGSPALKKVVLKACAFRPEDRYATPDELRKALWAALRGEAPTDNPPRQSAERSMPAMSDEDSPSGNWAAASRWSGEPSSMRDERSEGTMGCSWAAPSFEWGESSMPADSDLEETMPADGGPGRKESQPVKGNDLYREVSITPEQAEAGCQVTVEGYKGAKLSVTIPAHSPNGKQLRRRGRGYPGFNGGKNGDLMVTVRIRPQQAKSSIYKNYRENFRFLDTAGAILYVAVYVILNLILVGSITSSYRLNNTSCVVVGILDILLSIIIAWWSISAAELDDEERFIRIASFICLVVFCGVWWLLGNTVQAVQFVLVAIIFFRGIIARGLFVWHDNSTIRKGERK